MSAFVLIPEHIATDKTLSSNTKIVYGYLLAHYKNAKTNVKVYELARNLTFTAPSVYKNLEQLATQGYIRVDFEPNPTGLTVDRYITVIK